MGQRCTGTNMNGSPCKAWPLKGQERCRKHAKATANTPHRPRARDERWDRLGWLLCFDYTGMVTSACELMGVGRTTVYEERQRNEDFAVAWADVEERSTERMEREAIRRAVDGVETPLVSAGKLVTTVRTYSDGLLTFMLKSRRPERYRDNVKVEHGGTVNVELVPVAVDRGQRVASLLASTRAIASTNGHTNGNGNGNGHHN